MEHLQTDTSPEGLFSLPSELLLLIFTFVGFLNFRQDVRRLHVSRDWYPYAKAVLFSNLHLDLDQLESILGAMGNSATLAAAQQLTKHIELTMQTRGHTVRQPDFTYRPFDLERIEQMLSTLKELTALRTMTIRRPPGLLPISYLMIKSFFSLNQLTSLEMDLTNMIFRSDPCHLLCESINQLIPNLKSLRCRLPHMCDKMLESPPGDLKELIISITTGEWGFKCLHCSAFDACPPGSSDQLQTSLETRLLQLAASMLDPKIVRLIYDFPRSDTKCAFDAIKNRRLLLTNTPDWDEDGVLLPEDWDENSDISDEDSVDDEESLDDDEEMGLGDNSQAILEGEGDDDE